MSLKRTLLVGAIVAALPSVLRAQSSQPGGNTESENLAVAITPEPATLVLVASGLVAVVAVRRRKK